MNIRIRYDVLNRSDKHIYFCPIMAIKNNTVFPCTMVNITIFKNNIESWVFVFNVHTAYKTT